jgi:3-phosphoglycerate kinase
VVQVRENPTSPVNKDLRETSDLLRLEQELVGGSATIFWDGLLGVAECAASQSGTRAVTSSLMQAHDEAQKIVLVNGGTTGLWARRFSGLDDSGSSPAQVCASQQ